MIKHEKKISDLHEEVKNLQELVKIMTEKVSSLEQTPTFNNENKQPKETLKEAQDTEILFKCKQCKYECKKEIFMIKHKNTKHPSQVRDYNGTYQMDMKIRNP